MIRSSNTGRASAGPLFPVQCDKCIACCIKVASQSMLRRMKFSGSPAQRIIVTLIKAMDVCDVEALVSDQHPRAECTDCGKILDGEADGFGGSGKTTTAAP